MAGAGPGRWPTIPVAGWEDTRDTLQLYTQVVGKVRLANEPFVNHWWNVPLYVSARGLTTSLMPHPRGPAFEIGFDLPYEDVRTAPDPDALLLEFLQATYEAAASTAAWDRPALERAAG